MTVSLIMLWSPLTGKTSLTSQDMISARSLTVLAARFLNPVRCKLGASIYWNSWFSTFYKWCIGLTSWVFGGQVNSSNLHAPPTIFRLCFIVRSVFLLKEATALREYHSLLTFLQLCTKNCDALCFATSFLTTTIHFFSCFCYSKSLNHELVFPLIDVDQWDLDVWPCCLLIFGSFIVMSNLNKIKHHK